MTENLPDKTNGQAPLAMGDRGIRLTTLEEGYRFAKAVVQSGLAPKGDTAATVLVKLQAGAELGMPPMRALSSLVVIHGRLSIMGEAALAKIRAARVCAIGPTVEAKGEGEERVGVMRFKRIDAGPTEKPVEVQFSVAEARRAGLMTGDNYKKYMDDMLIWRAVSRASKRYFSDVLMGFDVAEVVKEYRVAENGGIAEVVPPDEPDPLLTEIKTETPAPEAGPQESDEDPLLLKDDDTTEAALGLE